MNNKTVIIALVVVVIVAAAAVAIVVVNNNNGNNEPTEKTITDARGRTVTVPNSVDKVVCLSAGSVRLVSYVAGIDRIVGIDDMDAKTKGMPANYYFATYRCAYDVESLTNVGSEENQKAIIETGAQVIITSMEKIGDLNTLQEQTGIPVVAVNAQGNITVSDETFKQNIRIVSKVMGTEKRGEDLLKGVENILAELNGYVSKVTQKDRAYIGGMFYQMVGGLTMTTGNYLPFTLGGATNSMPDIKDGNPYEASISGDSGIASSDAKYMFIDCMTNKNSKTMFEQYKETLSVLDAVKNGNIYSLFAYKYYGTNWESELYNAYYIGSLLHPDVYNYNVTEKVNTVLNLFYPDTGLNWTKLMERQQPGLVKLDW